MKISRKKALAAGALTSVLLTFPMFHTFADYEAAQVEITQCEIKDKTLTYKGSINIQESRAVTVIARKKSDPSVIAYMKVITTDSSGNFEGDIALYDTETASEFFDMEILFQCDEDTEVESLTRTYFNEKKKQESVQDLKASSSGIFEFMTSTEELTRIYENMGVRLDIYLQQENPKKSEMNSIAEKYKSEIISGNVVEIANGSLYTVLANNNDSRGMQSLINSFDKESKEIQIKKNTLLNTKRFSELDDDAQKFIADNVSLNMPKNGFKDYEEFYKAIRKSMFLNFANSTHYMELNELILENTDVLEDPMTELRNQSNANIVDKAMASIRKQAENKKFEKISDFISAVKSALKTAADNNSNTGTSTRPGGGGGGSSSGGSSSTISSVPANNSGNNSNGINKGFSDLKDYEWARTAIEKLAERGIVSGTDNNHFEPSRSIKREEFVKLICEAFGFGSGTSNGNFEDVKMTDWFAPYVYKAVEKGIIEGENDHHFGAGENITREDMAVIICRAIEKLGKELYGEGSIFADENEIADYAKQAVTLLSQNGIINGVGDDKFAPKQNASRAEAAVIIYRCMNKFFL